MGGHSWNAETQPDLTIDTWDDPFWIMGSYDGTIINYEPMFPLDFVTGKNDKNYVEDLTYVSQTIDQLPSQYTISYDGLTGFTTITLVGKSALCGRDFEKAKKGSKGRKSKKGSKGSRRAPP